MTHWSCVPFGVYRNAETRYLILQLIINNTRPLIFNEFSYGEVQMPCFRKQQTIIVEVFYVAR